MTVTHVLSGGVGPTGANIKAKVSGSSIRLAVSTAPAISSPAYFGLVSPSNGIATLAASGLQPNTQYYYAVEENGVLQTAKIGKFATHGVVGEPYSFLFAAGSCAGGAGNTAYPIAAAAHPQYVSNHPVFLDVLAQNPLFLMHCGDLHYYNITRTGDAPLDGGSWPTNSLSSWRRAYDDVLLGTQGTLLQNVPLQYIWDNHDSAQPTVDDGSSNRHAAGMANAAAVYRERVPSYALPAADGQGIYHSFQIGRVLFMASDTRTYRDDPVSDPSPRTYLGAAQLSWMDATLAAAAADDSVKFLVWQQTQDWNNDTTVPSGNSWGRYGTERSTVRQMLGDHGFLSRMMTICGDTHAMAFDNGGGNAHGGFPMVLASSFDSDQNIGPSYNLGRLGSQNGGVRGQWATIQINDIGSQIDINVKGWYWTP